MTQKEAINQKAEQFWPYIMTMEHYNTLWWWRNEGQRYLEIKKLLDLGMPKPLLVEFGGDIWIYDKDHLGKTFLKKSENPKIYQKISFPKSPKNGKATEEINQEIRSLKIKHLEDEEKESTSSILRIEAQQNEITQRREKLILAAAQHDLLPSKENIAQAAEKFKRDNYGTIIPENIISESEQQEINKFIQTTAQQGHSEAAIESPELTKIIGSLKEQSFNAFKHIIIEVNICDILSRDSNDEGRKLLIENLQNAPLYDSAYSQLPDIPTNKEIDNVDFSDAKMWGGDFKHVNFSHSGATFSGAMLAGATFSGARLASVDFSDAGMQGVNLCNAELQGVLFSGTDLSDVNFEYSDRDLHDSYVHYTDVTAEQLLQAKDLRNIGISSETLKHYSAEAQIKLQDKLVTDYKIFFAKSTNVAEILESARIISSSTHYPKYLNPHRNFNLLGKLNAIIDPNNQKNCEELLDLAYQQMIAVIQNGAEVTEELVKKLDDPGYERIFGEEKTAVLKQEIKWSKNYRAYMELLRPLEEETSEKTADQLEAVFEKMAILFEIDGSRAIAVFEHFNSTLARLYGEDDTSRLETLLSLSLLSPIKDNSQFIFYLAQALWFLKGNAGFSSETEKWELILSLLENSTHPETEKLQTKVFRNLLAGSPQLGFSNQSLAQLVGVDYIVTYTILKGIGKALNWELIGKGETELLKKFRGKTIAVYEQLVMAPGKKEFITIPAADKAMNSPFWRFLPNQKKYRISLQQQTNEQLEQLDRFINKVSITFNLATIQEAIGRCLKAAKIEEVEDTKKNPAYLVHVIDVESPEYLALFEALRKCEEKYGFTVAKESSNKFLVITENPAASLANDFNNFANDLKRSYNKELSIQYHAANLRGLENAIKTEGLTVERLRDDKEKLNYLRVTSNQPDELTALEETSATFEELLNMKCTRKDSSLEIRLTSERNAFIPYNFYNSFQISYRGRLPQNEPDEELVPPPEAVIQKPLEPQKQIPGVSSAQQTSPESFGVGETPHIPETTIKESILLQPQQVEPEPIFPEEAQEPSPVKQGRDVFLTILEVALFMTVTALAIAIGFGIGGPVGAAVGAIIGVAVGGIAVAAIEITTQSRQEIVPEKNPGYPETESESEGEKINPALGIPPTQVFSPANPDTDEKDTASRKTSHDADQKNTNIPT